MKLQRIRYFVTLAQTRSFTRTAEAHFVSQTTVSQQIRALEDELGCRLFERTKRNVALTAAGEAFLPDARRALEIIDRAEERAQLACGQEMLGLHVGLIDGVTPAYAAPRLNAFREANPDVRLSCSYLRTDDLVPAVVAGEVDAGLTYDVFGIERDDLLKVQIDRLPQYVVVGSHSPLAQHVSLTRADLAGETFVNTLESRSFIPQGALAEESHDGAAEVPVRGAVRTDVLVKSMDELLLALSMGAGYTLMAAPVVQGLSPALNLAAVPVTGELVSLVALCRADGQNPAVLRFLDALRMRD